MRLIVTEKNNSAKKIADILGAPTGGPREDKTFKVPYYTWTDEEGGEHRGGAQRHLEEAHRGPHSGGGTPGACTRRRLGDLADSWPSPGSLPPGQGFEARAASWNGRSET